jgi:tRNA(Leu) C34 or U34 (ribose-2'-O)-methylase TrmL
MPNDNVRSLNLATSVGIALYEALRQTDGFSVE